MQKILAAAAMVLIAGSALAQTTITTTRTITPTQQGAIQTYVTQERTTSIEPPAGFTVVPGAVIPQNVQVYTFPAQVGVNYRYLVMGGRTVLVDPADNHVVAVLN